jgi:predicted ATPase
MGASLKDLGLHRLKDLGRPEQIFQLQAEGLTFDFPPLRSLDNPELPNNLPGFLSAFVGREAELAEVRSLVESSRLVTLTGAGGSGKTRLGLQVAAELLDGSGDGVFFVDLATIAQSEQVPGAVLAALEIREQAGRPPLEQLLDILQEQQVIIILDNCEHVVDACAKVADLVERGCPKVHLVATSREPLGIDGEHVYRVRPLSLPSEDAATIEDLEGSDAVELFVERVRAHDDSFSLEDPIAGLVSSICRRLDGIPFAIELAAARLASMSLVHLNERLNQRFRLLTGGARTALPRQQTLQATVDWSFELLNAPEQAVLRRLSVFVGGFELEAAEAVCASATVEAFDVADLLGSLVNKSLVVAERSSGSLRYRLLETIRQYAADKLARTEGEAETRQAQSAHAEFYVQLSETAAPELVGPRQGPWLRKLDLEWDNIRTGLAYLFAEPDRTEEVLRLGVALHAFFSTRGHLEPVAQLRAALDRPDPVAAGLRARALFVTGELLLALLGLEVRLELRTVEELDERALEIARDLDDRALVAEALSGLSAVAALLEDIGRATRLGEEALEVARGVGDPRLIGNALRSLAVSAPTPEERRILRLEALACFRQAGDVASVSLVLVNLAIYESADRQLEAARAHFEEAMVTAEETGSSRYLTTLWQGLGFVLLLQGELEEAALLCRKSLIACRRLARRGADAAFALLLLSCCATGAEDYRRAAQLTGAHDVIEADILDLAPKRGYDWTPWEQEVRDDNRARLRQVLGDDGFERAYVLGRGLSFEEAVDLALGRVRSA